MTTRNYSNTASDATLSALIGPADTTFALGGLSGFPAQPHTAAIDPDTPDEEVVLVTNVSGSTVTVTRGYDGTTAKTHSAGAVLRHVAVAKDFQEANSHINATSAVHGLSGAPVGTSDTQTLSNKTLTSPTITSPTVTGTATMGSAAFSGTVTIPTGSITSLTVGSASVTADLGVGGSLTVGGVASLASASLTGTLGVAGAATFSGTVTVPTPTVGGQAATKTYADGVGTSAATPSTIMRRDSSGNTAVDAVTLTDQPTAAGHATRRDFVLAQIADAVDPFLVGRQAITITSKQPTATALTPLITLAAADVATRVVFEATGRAGFDDVSQKVSWDWVNLPGGATSTSQDDALDQVSTGPSEWATVTSTLVMDLPAGVAATAQLRLRCTGNVYSRGAVTYTRMPT